MNKILKKYFQIFFGQSRDRLLLLGFVAVGLLLVFLDLRNGHQESSLNKVIPNSADTMIPAGFVLVPIEIQNVEALESLTNGFAVVDLFTTANQNQKSGQLVGRRLRLLQAPLNPHAYAVLVPEHETSRLLGAVGPFVVAIQNRQLVGMGEVSMPQVKVSRVQYYQGVRK